MTTGTFQINLDIYTLTSSLIETKTFYNVFLDIGQKQAELSQKKTSNIPGLINFNEGIYLKLQPQELQSSNYQAKLSIYSIHHYGRKKLLGNVQFILPSQGSQQYKLKLQSCEDELSSLQFRCRLTKIESRVFSRKNSAKSSINEKIFQQISSPISIRSARGNGTLNLQSKQHMSSQKQVKIDDDEEIRNTIFTLPHRAATLNPQESKETINKNGQISISTNLQLMQSCEKVLGDLKNTQHKNKLEQQYRNTHRKHSKGIIADKILQITNNLNEIHKKQDLFKDDDKLLEMVQKPQKPQASFKTFKKISTQKSLNNDHHLKLRSNTIDFVYYNSRVPAKLKVGYCIDDDFYGSSKSYRSLKMFKDQAESPPQAQKEQKEESICSEELKHKVAIIKPKLKPTTSIQEYQNDDNLSNIVRSMIDDVKGNLGYIKLSKLNHLRNQIKEIKDKNKHLLWANQAILSEQTYLSKKVKLAQQIINQKEEIIAKEFEELRNQFKEVTSKLLDKYKEQIEMQNKIKNYQEQVKICENKIKELEHKISLKDKQVQHYKQLLIAEDKASKDGNKEDDTISFEAAFSSLKDKKFQRSSSNKKLFKDKRTDSSSSRVTISHKSQNQTPDKKLKGINPDFRDFFMTFISKPEEPVEKQKQPQLTKHHLKRGMAQHRQQILDIPLKQQQGLPPQSSQFFMNI